ncbi:MAG: CheR family methyltransferase, partial [Spirochaetota bacterium]
DDMPRNGLSTGLVDFALPPEEMPEQLIAYAKYALAGPPALAATFPEGHQVDVPDSGGTLNRIFALLRSRTGHDFYHYKPSTIERRIQRRMAVHHLGDVNEYVTLLDENPAEVGALFRDMLIGVTQFFRDPEAFDALEQQVLPMLFSGRDEGEAIRVWVPGCSTGEEAYSLAILLQERIESQSRHDQIQIFATDIDSEAVRIAREGRYPGNIRANISEERLSRFFTPEPAGDSGIPPAYRVNERVRDLIVFSKQSIIRDPPFSRLDLISCRNLLIYLKAGLQQKLLSLFHYALKPQGFLFLGTSETVGETQTLFLDQDRSAKIYRRRDDFHGLHREVLSASLPPITRGSYDAPDYSASPFSLAARLPLRELTENALLRTAVPVAVLVTASGDILYVHGRTGMYLEPAAGEAGVNNILEMARDGLQQDMTVALQEAAGIGKTVRRPGVSVKTNGDYSTVDLTVLPVPFDPGELSDNKRAAGNEELLFLVILQETLNREPTNGDRDPEMRDAEGTGVETTSDHNASPIMEVKRQLQAKEEYARAINEELKTSNEELRSSNEETQSVNEELQSSNEELKTSKEELQSINEELYTVNAELQTKVSELSRANNDLNNLLSGTGVATVFVDRRLRILRFTPAATEIINLIDSDAGRPVGHVMANFRSYSRLTEDVTAVLDTLVPREMHLQTTDGRWYVMRILPYRTLENIVEGASITFVDITELIETQQALRASQERSSRLAVVVRDATDAITVYDLDGHITAWNPGAVRAYGWSEAEALGMNVMDRIPDTSRAGASVRFQQLSQAEVLDPYSTELLTKSGNRVRVSMVSTALVNEDGKTYAIATTERVMGLRQTGTK